MLRLFRAFFRLNLGVCVCVCVCVLRLCVCVCMYIHIEMGVKGRHGVRGYTDADM